VLVTGAVVVSIPKPVVERVIGSVLDNGAVLVSNVLSVVEIGAASI